MADHRRERVEHQVQHELASLLLREAKDPRLQRVTVTSVRMSPDLRNARVFYRTLDEGDHAPVQAALERAGHFLRGAIGRALAMRVTPELRFEYDHLPDTARRLDRLLHGQDSDDEGTT